MIKTIDKRIIEFIDFLNLNYPTVSDVSVAFLAGHDCIEAGEDTAYACYSPAEALIYLPTEIPEKFKELRDELERDFIILNLAHEFAHFLQDVKGEDFGEEGAEEFAAKAVLEFVIQETT